MTKYYDAKKELIRDIHNKIVEAGLASHQATDGRVNPDEPRTYTSEEEESWAALRKTGDPYR